MPPAPWALARRWQRPLASGRPEHLWPRPLFPPEPRSKEATHAGTRAEAAHLGVHCRRRTPSGHRPETAEEQGGFANRKEAETALHEFIRSVEAGGDPCPERIELAAYLGRWLEDQRVRGTRVRTLEAYAGYIRREIVPVIGRVELAALRPHHVRAVLLKMQERGHSPATIAQVRSVLGSALRQAVADGIITANPVAAVKRPRIQRKEPHWPTSAQLTALLRASRATIWEIPVLLAAVTRARRSEVLGIS